MKSNSLQPQLLFVFTDEYQMLPSKHTMVNMASIRTAKHQQLCIVIVSTLAQQCLHSALSAAVVLLTSSSREGIIVLFCFIVCKTIQ